MLVFVLHPDVEVLAALTGRMRVRGLETAHATEAAPLLERGQKQRPLVIVAPDHATSVRGAAELAALRGAFPGTPEIPIPPLDPADEVRVAAVVDAVTSAIVASAPADKPAAGAGEVRGDLAQIPLPDLLQLLSMGKKTGTLTVTTGTGGGELRLHDGEVVDAMFRRTEGLKAVIRLLGERDGAFHFAPDASPTLRRIVEPMSTILMEGTRQVDEVRRLREALGFKGAQVALQVVDARAFDADPTIKDTARLLASPRLLDELLDDDPRTDLEILRVLGQIDKAGALVRLPLGELRPSLGGPEGLVVLRGLLRRLRPRGYRGHARLVLVGKPATIARARKAAARIAEAAPGADAGSETTSDRVMESTVVLQLGEGVTLELVTLVDRPELVPTFPIVLAGAVGLVSLDRPSPALGELVEELEVALVDARSVAEAFEDRPLEPGDPVSLAGVIRGAIEGMGAT
ncbi:MAG: DUF4388 domain-containing protein [Myxococcales bacterium]|nr:DUF4388 domain-containing protein [Myxococcales bacterium]